MYTYPTPQNIKIFSICSARVTKLQDRSICGMCGHIESFVIHKHVLWTMTLAWSFYTMNLLFCCRNGSFHSNSKPQGNRRDWQQCPSSSPILCKASLTSRGKPAGSSSSGMHFQQPQEEPGFVSAGKKPQGLCRNPSSCASLSSSELHKQLLTIYTIM